MKALGVKNLLNGLAFTGIKLSREAYDELYILCRKSGLILPEPAVETY